MLVLEVFLCGLLASSFARSPTGPGPGSPPPEPPPVGGDESALPPTPGSPPPEPPPVGGDESALPPTQPPPGSDGSGLPPTPGLIDTKCTRAQAEAMKMVENIPDFPVPICDSNGKYEQVQCYYPGGCHCVDPETGVEIEGTHVFPPERPNCGGATADATEPATKCLQEQKDAQKMIENIPDFPIPICAPDGKYEAVQCYYPGGCHCVDPETGSGIPGSEVPPGQFPDCENIGPKPPGGPDTTGPTGIGLPPGVRPPSPPPPTESGGPEPPVGPDTTGPPGSETGLPPGVHPPAHTPPTGTGEPQPPGAVRPPGSEIGLPPGVSPPAPIGPQPEAPPPPPPEATE